MFRRIWGHGQGKRRVIGGAGSLRFRVGFMSTFPTLVVVSLVAVLQVLLSICPFFPGSALKTLQVASAEVMD